MTKPLADIRLEIDEIDQQLVRLIASRGELVKQASQVKKTAQEVEAPDRVAQVIDKEIIPQKTTEYCGEIYAGQKIGVM